MLERARSLFTKKKHLSLEQKRNVFKHRFFGSEFHTWILQNKYTQSSFETLIDHFTEDVLDFLRSSDQLVFVPSNGKLSCALSSLPSSHTILIFPDLAKILRSACPETGIAILAHELGHLYRGHSHRKISPLDAQIEADYFAYQLGFGHGLQDVLVDHQESIDCKVRISRLTSLLLTEGHEA